MNKRLLQRRSDLLRQSVTGAPLKLIVEVLSDKYNVDEKTLYADWERRRHWVPQIVQLEDPTLLHQLIRGAQDVLAKAWLVAETSKNSFAKLKALTLIKDTNLGLLKAFQSIGLISQRPIQVDQRILVIRGRWWLPGSGIGAQTSHEEAADQTDQLEPEQHDGQRSRGYDIPLS
jgi:hypothetical protein